MVSELASSAVDHVFEPQSGLKNQQRSAKTGWLGIRIMCQSGVTCQSPDYCCFSELAL